MTDELDNIYRQFMNEEIARVNARNSNVTSELSVKCETKGDEIRLFFSIDFQRLIEVNKAEFDLPLDAIFEAIKRTGLSKKEICELIK